MSNNQQAQDAGQSKVRVSGKTITIEKENAIIEITDVIYLQTQTGTYEGGGVITIHPLQQATQTEQQKTIKVEIFNLKEDIDSFNAVEDCSLNDRVVERTYTVRVVHGRGVEASTLKPLIQNLRFDRTKEIGQPISISAKITHTTPIERATVEIVGPEFRETFEMRRNGDIFEFEFDTNGRNKGKYTGDIYAESRAKTTSNLKFDFELKEPKST